MLPDAGQKPVIWLLKTYKYKFLLEKKTNKQKAEESAALWKTVGLFPAAD